MEILDSVWPCSASVRASVSSPTFGKVCTHQVATPYRQAKAKEKTITYECSTKTRCHVVVAE
jgi:hypothetical protein